MINDVQRRADHPVVGQRSQPKKNVAHLADAGNVEIDPMLMSIGRDQTQMLDPRPAQNSPAFGGDMSREEKRERLLDAMAEDRVEKQEKLEKQKAIKEQNRRKCNAYRDRMRHYERASALYKLDDDGNRVYMSEADRARATKDLRAKISKYCR